MKCTQCGLLMQLKGTGCACDECTPASSGTVEGVVGRDLIDNLILKLLNAYLKMSPDQYAVADRDTLQTLWRHPCGQDVLNRAARLYDIERMRMGKRCDMCYDASERDKAHCALCSGTGFIANK